MSSSDYYLSQLLKKQKPTDELKNMIRHTSSYIINVIHQEIREPEVRFYYAGAFKKGTALKDIFDLNLVVTYPKTSYKSPKGIYDEVREILQKQNLNPWTKGVALRCNFVDKGFGTYQYDIIPGKATTKDYYYIELYRPRKNKNFRTSIRAHVDAVRSVRHRYTIKFLKLWRRRYGFACPTFILEMLFINYLSTDKPGEMYSLLKGCFKYIADNILDMKLVDPVNVANIISDELSQHQKHQLQDYAEKAYNAKHWSQVFEK
ncbi:MAG: hypothetical protein ACFFBD_01790 [Candidatus Hodarchaeota archaeon]